MNKGLALIALVLSIVALLVTIRPLLGGHDADRSSQVDPIDQLRKLEARLTELRKQADAASLQSRGIATKLQKLEEGTSFLIKGGARRAATENPVLQRLVQTLVRKEMDRRLALKSKPKAPKAVPAKRTPPKKGTNQKFQDMVNSLIKSASLPVAEVNNTRNAFTVCRAKLKAAQGIYNKAKKARPKQVKTAAASRDRQFIQIRKWLERELKQKLSTTSFARYEAWKNKELTKPIRSYIKTFYGK